MPKTSLHAFKAKDTRFVADWLKSKGLRKLCSVFKGIQEPFILSLACKSVVSFLSIIKATEKFPGDGGIWSPGMDLWWGIWTPFRPQEGEFEQKFSKNSNAREVARGGGMLNLRFAWYISKTHNWFNIKHLIEKVTLTTDWIKHTTDRKSRTYNWLNKTLNWSNVNHNWSKKPHVQLIE